MDINERVNALEKSNGEAWRDIDFLKKELKEIFSLLNSLLNIRMVYLEEEKSNENS